MSSSIDPDGFSTYPSKSSSPRKRFLLHIVGDEEVWSHRHMLCGISKTTINAAYSGIAEVSKDPRIAEYFG
jgi:hypothetical protein